MQQNHVTVNSLVAECVETSDGDVPIFVEKGEAGIVGL